MTLPIISQPLFDVEIPSSKQKIKIKPMVTREEKILLIAKESADDNDILTAIKQVVSNCMVSEKIKIDNISLIDLEWLFVRLRAISVSNKIAVSYLDKEDEQTYPFEVDLDKVIIKWPPENITRTIQLDTNTHIIMKYPGASLYNNEDFLALSFEDTGAMRKLLDILLRNSIEKIIQGERVSTLEGVSKEELNEFIDSIPLTAREKINEFLGNLPTLYYEIKYTNSKGTERSVKMTKLNDFFTY